MMNLTIVISTPTAEKKSDIETAERLTMVERLRKYLEWKNRKDSK